MRLTYLDNNATTKVAPTVVEAMHPFLADEYGNPSSAHTASDTPSAMIARSRESVAKLVGARSSSEIVFTSGGTESDNWAIRGAIDSFGGNKGHIVTTAVEHEAVRNQADRLSDGGNRVTVVGVDGAGRLNIEALAESVTERTAVVSIMLANNETGVIFPIEEAVKIVKERSDALFHVDAVNAAGKITIEAEAWGVDLLSLSAHKFHGPKGVGALYIRDGVRIPPSSIGGGQENGLRAGTEATHQIAGIGAAAELVKDFKIMNQVRELRDRLEEGIRDTVADTSVNGGDASRIPNTTNVSFSGINGERLVAALNRQGICVSTGSACNEATRAVSPVLAAMEVPFEDALGSIRFSLSRFTTSEEIEFVLSKLPGLVSELRRQAGG